MKNYIIYEFLEEKVTDLQKEFESFIKLENFLKEYKNGYYSTKYDKKEPPYPYILAREEEITKNGIESSNHLCFFAK